MIRPKEGASHVSFSLSHSRIPKLIIGHIRSVPTLNAQRNNYINSLNLKAQRSKRSKIAISERRLRTNHSNLRVANNSEEIKCQESIDCEEINVKLRAVRGRSRLLSDSNDCTKSDPIDYGVWNTILEIIRSDLNANDKLLTIKKYRDKRIGLMSNMEQKKGYDNTKVKEWIDSGYMSNNDIHDIHAKSSVGDEEHVREKPNLSSQESLTKRVEPYNWVRHATNRRSLELIALRHKYNSFNSDVSMSSISSIESLLESRREDPEELLLSLGFGYATDDEPLSRIPHRFLESPSHARGVNLDHFLRNCGLFDLSALSSPSLSSDNCEGKSINNSDGPKNQTEKKKFNERQMSINDSPEITLAVLSRTSSNSDSILNPANRQFLDNQGKSDEQIKLGIKRLIIGTKSYCLDVDDEPLAMPKTPSPLGTTPVLNDIKLDFDKNLNDDINDINDVKSLDSVSSLSKKRTLQRQRRVSDDAVYNSNKLDVLTIALNEMSSELSSSTTTLVGNVSAENSETNDLLQNNCDNSDSGSCEYTDKRHVFCQTDDTDLNNENTAAIEAALRVAIQSLKLSIEFYKHQSSKIEKNSKKRYDEEKHNFTDEDCNRLAKICHLRSNIHHELVNMNELLNLQLDRTKNSIGLSGDMINEAHTFIEVIKNMTDLLREQNSIYDKNCGSSGDI